VGWRILSGDRSGEEVLPQIQAAVQTNRLAERYLSIRKPRTRTPKTRHDDAPPDERVMRRQRKAARDAGPQWDEDQYNEYGKDDKYTDDDEEDDELAELMERNERRRDALLAFGEQIGSRAGCKSLTTRTVVRAVSASPQAWSL
jgi:hypothetical protein